MQQDLFDQDFITLREACILLPNRPHVSTIIRWVERGIGGHRLLSWRIGGVRYTSREALINFVNATSGNAVAVRKTLNQREKEIRKAEDELKKLGL